ncbi:MAG: ABC transporter substrate-binding protein [Clostridiales Family XIII bacterium]|nr:ABC transporter substrate-binding protein [Clostridiales Family XIII bacterium]
MNMKTKKKRWIIALCTAVVLLFAACGGGGGGGGEASDTGSDENAASGDLSGETIKIAAMMPMTGTGAADGEMMANAIELAVDEQNEAGGILGAKIELKIEDGGSTQDSGMNIAQKIFMDDSYDMILGPHFSVQMLAIASIIDENQRLQISGATSVAVAEAVTNPYMLQNRVIDRYTAAAAAKFISEDLGCKKIGILAANDDFGQTAVDRITGYLDDHNVEYIVQTCGVDDKDFTSQLMTIKNENCDALLLWTLSDPYVACSRQVYELGMNESMACYASGGPTSPDMRARMEPEWYDGWYSTCEYNNDSSDESVLAFKESYSEKYGIEPNFLAAGYYAGLQYYFAAIEQAGSKDKDDVTVAMGELQGFQTLNGIYNKPTDTSDKFINKSMQIIQLDENGTLHTQATLDFTDEGTE